jgi:hypothetical protein
VLTSEAKRLSKPSEPHYNKLNAPQGANLKGDIMQNQSEKNYMTTEEIDATIAEQDVEQEQEEKDDLLELLGF